MKVRKLDVNEIQQGVHLARWVFECCIRNRNANPMLEKYFNQYVDVDNLMGLHSQGRLTIWGVYEKEQLIGVSAMEQNGMITMLYVHPACQRRGYGKALINEMLYFGYEEYKADRVFINVMPSWNVNYFMRRKFFPQQRYDIRTDLFVPMSAETCKLIRYKTKKIPPMVLVGIILGFLGVILVSTVLFEFWYMYV